ncbi:hypothetical protein WN48_04329 [Eufriesea mexicana]|nr:hypothetical protein WN48_04329 [Eufriesea mexicana]
MQGGSVLAHNKFGLDILLTSPVFLFSQLSDLSFNFTNFTGLVNVTILLIFGLFGCLTVF